MLNTGYERTDSSRRGEGYTLDLDVSKPTDTAALSTAGASATGSTPAASEATGSEATPRLMGAYTPAPAGTSTVQAMVEGLLNVGATVMASRKGVTWYDGSKETPHVENPMGDMMKSPAFTTALSKSGGKKPETPKAETPAKVADSVQAGGPNVSNPTTGSQTGGTTEATV